MFVIVLIKYQHKTHIKNFAHLKTLVVAILWFYSCTIYDCRILNTIYSIYSWTFLIRCRFVEFVRFVYYFAMQGNFTCNENTWGINLNNEVSRISLGKSKQSNYCETQKLEKTSASRKKITRARVYVFYSAWISVCSIIWLETRRVGPQWAWLVTCTCINWTNRATKFQFLNLGTRPGLRDSLAICKFHW